jgi:hypothetical protein
MTQEFINTLKMVRQEIVRLEYQIKQMKTNEETLIKACNHTLPNGKSAIIFSPLEYVKDHCSICGKLE